MVDYEAKWQPQSAAYGNTPRRFGLEAAEPALAGALRAVALEVWLRCGLRGYARVDARVDGDERIYIIDVNANPGIGPDAGFVATAATAGLNFDQLVLELVAAARSVVRAAA